MEKQSYFETIKCLKSSSLKVGREELSNTIVSYSWGGQSMARNQHVAAALSPSIGGLWADLAEIITLNRRSYTK